MLHALEEEPEDKGRWQRLGVGSLIAASIAGGMLFAAQHYAPTRELLTRVVSFAVVAPPPLPEDTTPPPPLPPPPPRKEAPKPQNKQAPAPAPKSDPTPQAGDPQQVGLDAQSFGGGGEGPGFHVGGNQMGDPNVRTTPIAKPAVVAPAAPARRKVVAARVVKQDPPPTFTDRARKLGIEGLLVIELDIDENGRVQAARVRKGLEPQVDREALSIIKRWIFAPAIVEGKAIATTQLFRYRYEFSRN